MKKIFMLYIVFSLSILPIFSQSEVTHLTNNISENISLTTDRDYYLSGEKIWFKAQGFVALDIPGTQLSNVLYIELFNASHQSFVRKKFRVRNGKVSGMFTIPQELISGNYLLRAYTQYHRNSLPETFSTQNITIINPSLQLPEKLIITNDIEILPEFGFLLSNIENNVAINYGHNAEIAMLDSWLEDNYKNKITEVKITNRTGVFQFIPNADTEYSLYTVDNNDTIISILPLAQSRGIVMRTTESNSNNQLDLEVINQQLINQQIKVGIYSKHFNKVSEIEVKLVNGTNHIAFPSTSLNPGFNYFILKNNQDEILSILSHYVFHTDIVEVRIRPDQPDYNRRSKIQLEISPTENVNELIDLSITVAKKGTFSIYDNALPTYLLQNPILLDSYLRSNPKLNIDGNSELEALLIKFNNEIASNTELRMRLNDFTYEIDWVPEIRDVSLSGFVRNKETQEPIVNAEVFASVFKTNPQVHVYNTDNKGFFIFSLNNLTETQDVFLSINNNTTNDEELELLVNNDFSSSYPFINPFPLNIDSTQIPFIEELYINDQASKIFKTEVGRVAKPSLKLPFSFMNPEFSIDLDDYVANPTLEVVFRELIPLVKIKHENENFILTVTDPVRRISQSNPLIMVDYITIFDINEVMAINPANIKKIDIYTTPFVLGNSQFNGVILITTKTDNFGGMKMPRASVFFEYTTISDSYNFDPPNYETDEKVSNRKADFRNLLYWDADLKVKDTKTINFYASDHCSEYEIIVRGYTKDGRLCYGKASIEIVK